MIGRRRASEPAQSVELRRPGVLTRWAVSAGRRRALSVARYAGAAALAPVALVAVVAALAAGAAIGVCLYLMLSSGGGERR